MSNYIDPGRDQFEAFKALPRDEPIMMLNLLRFREKAAVLDSRLIRTTEADKGQGFALPQ
ncbi:MAG: hypothetical protein P8X53_12910 [Chromatiales bacterium]|jgi:hypothetical protein